MPTIDARADGQPRDNTFIWAVKNQNNIDCFCPAIDEASSRNRGGVSAKKKRILCQGEEEVGNDKISLEFGVLEPERRFALPVCLTAACKRPLLFLQNRVGARIRVGTHAAQDLRVLKVDEFGAARVAAFSSGVTTFLSNDRRR